VILLLLSFASAAVTTLNHFSAEKSGGTNMFLALVVCWASVRAVQAAFTLAGLKRKQASRGGNP
jgi:hypothetical protein